MRRALGRLLIALLLLIAVGAAVLWARGPWVSDTVWYDRRGYGGAVMSHRGVLSVCGSRGRSQEPKLRFQYHPWPAERVDRFWPFVYTGVDRFSTGGFALSVPTAKADQPGYWCVEVPLWFVLLATLPPAVLLWRRDRRRGRDAGEGRCRACGYDLRATPDRCPECGTPAAPASGDVAFPAPGP